MTESIKNRYNYESLYKVAMDIQSVYEAFQVDEFLKSTMDDTWDGDVYKRQHLLLKQENQM